MLDEDFQEFDDGEAFANTLVHFGRGIIDHWLDYRAKHWPAMEDRDFLPVLDGVRTILGEMLGPEQIKELWDQACWMYFEDKPEKTSWQERLKMTGQFIAAAGWPSTYALG